MEQKKKELQKIEPSDTKQTSSTVEQAIQRARQKIEQKKKSVANLASSDQVLASSIPTIHKEMLLNRRLVHEKPEPLPQMNKHYDPRMTVPKSEREKRGF